MDAVETLRQTELAELYIVEVALADGIRNDDIRIIEAILTVKQRLVHLAGLYTETSDAAFDAVG